LNGVVSLPRSRPTKRLPFIYLYTLDSPFYRNLNKLLREKDRKKLKPFFPYLKLFLGGIRRITAETAELHRGVRLDFKEINKNGDYVVGETVIW
jgi:hypothetical protein